MDNQIELKRLIADFNVVVGRLNKAEKYFEDNKNSNDCEKYLEAYTNLLKKASEFANRIEVLLGRPLTSYESLNGINI